MSGGGGERSGGSWTPSK
jgi:hypothetical protein